jgi:hypothetical protein
MSILLYGCASAPANPDGLFATDWRKPGAGDAELAGAKGACFSEATAAAVGDRSTDRFRYIMCMEREGWSRETPSEMSFTEDWKAVGRSQAQLAIDDSACRDLAAAMHDSSSSRPPKRADRSWVHLRYLSCMDLKGWKR